MLLFEMVRVAYPAINTYATIRADENYNFDLTNSKHTQYTGKKRIFRVVEKSKGSNCRYRIPRELTLPSLLRLLNSGIVMTRSVTWNWPHSLVISIIDCLVIPGRMSPFKGLVISSRSVTRYEQVSRCCLGMWPHVSWGLSACRYVPPWSLIMKMKMFIVPASVIWWSSPYSHSTWWNPCLVAVFCKVNPTWKFQPEKWADGIFPKRAVIVRFFNVRRSRWYRVRQRKKG